ncbi:MULTISPECIES: DUF4259 domain-containing protein [Arthrobacter]|uniref:DUF4259 domain-containing protein n=1 Tax=Arthrobacter terricola TaxID=2547396 RepID=A0A4R5KAY7_9MICC|nr:MULTISPECIES: DUF4259 domain-containing protein [Arthrobacter]TDF92403.1 DUF4259 domain-containing protein [Arthrobacter terricola]
MRLCDQPTTGKGPDGRSGFLPFGNDGAMDWPDELDDGSMEIVRTALEAADAAYLEASFDIKPGTSTMIIPDPLEDVARIPVAR